MNGAALAEEISILKATLAQREARIERLEFDLAQLKKLLFGARSERLQNLPGIDQLPLWAEVPEDAPRRQSGGVQDGGAIARQESAQTHRAAGASAA